MLMEESPGCNIHPMSFSFLQNKIMGIGKHGKSNNTSIVKGTIRMFIHKNILYSKNAFIT